MQGLNSHRESYRRAQQYYDNDDLTKCTYECQKLLSDSACPRYFCIKAHILLGATAGDISEATRCYQEALKLWQAARSSQIGVAAVEALQDLKKDLDSLRDELAREAQEQDVKGRGENLLKDGKAHKAAGEERGLEQNPNEDTSARTKAQCSMIGRIGGLYRYWKSQGFRGLA